MKHDYACPSNIVVYFSGSLATATDQEPCQRRRAGTAALDRPLLKCMASLYVELDSLSGRALGKTLVCGATTKEVVNKAMMVWDL